MSTLLVTALRDELTQELEFWLQERVHIGSLSPMLYFHNPTGEVTFELSSTNGIVYSYDFNFSDIQESLGTSSNYVWAFAPAIPQNPTQIESGIYTATLKPGPGYSFSESSFIGWCQQFENIQNSMDYIPFSDIQNSFAIRFKEYKEGILCQG